MAPTVAGPALASPPDVAISTLAADVSVRFAVHDTFDRLVLLLPPGTQATSHQSGDKLALALPGCAELRAPARLGRRLLGVSSTAGQAEIQVTHDAPARVWRLGDRLVIDVLNAAPIPPAHPLGGPVASVMISRPPGPRNPATAPPPGQSRPDKPPANAQTAPDPSTRAAPATPASPAPVRQAALPPADKPRTGSPDIEKLPLDGTAPSTKNALEPPVSASPAAPAPASGPVLDSAVLPLPRSSDLDGASILLPCPRGTGAAAFQRAGEAYVILDQGKPLDLGALKDDPVFGDLREQVLSDGLELRMHMPAGSQLRLSPRPDGWALTAMPSSRVQALPALTGRAQGGTLALDMAEPGRVVVLGDEATGAKLLVATQTGSGQRMPAAHAAPEFTLLPTWFGLVVAPVSDRLVLRKSATGFELAQASPDLALAWSKGDAVSWPGGRVMTRLFDLRDMPPDSLHRQLAQAMRDAALAPRSARFKPRLAVGRAMLAEGMDAEAAAVLHTATADDPAHLGDVAVDGLSAIAGWLSAKAGAADAPPLTFDPVRLGTSDEAALWRALLQPGTPDPASQAALLAPVWPLIFSYPEPLRRPMLSASAALLQAGGQTGAWAALLDASSDPVLDISRARLLQQQGKTDAALALLDRVASRPDRFLRAQAMRQALDLRLAAGKLSPAAAADSLDRQLYAWRGGDTEMRSRLRLAELRAQAGQWRAALATLRTAEELFPEAGTSLHEAEAKTLADLMGGGHASKLTSFDLVTLTDEAANLFSSADVERRLGPILVDKLLALDLPDRAEPVLRKLFDRAQDSTSKAEYGYGLASLIADRGDNQAALDTLGVAEDAGLPSGLSLRRDVLRARLLGASGKVDEALSVLAHQHGAESSDLRATLLERRADWSAAAAVLTTGMQHPDFAAMQEPAQRAWVLRLARDESAGGDAAGLRALREAEQHRFRSGEGAELFAALTADPIKSEADLARSGRELVSLQALPAKLAQAPAL